MQECDSTAANGPGWVGRALRLAVGAFLVWYGIQALQQAEWVVPGLLVAIAIPIVDVLGLFTFESMAKRTVSTPELRLWTRVYFIVVLVALGIWRGVEAAGGPFLVFLGSSMLLAALFRYGGCEVMAIPNLVLRRNYVAFCLLFSPIDRLEQRFGEWLSRR